MLEDIGPACLLLAVVPLLRHEVERRWSTVHPKHKLLRNMDTVGHGGAAARAKACSRMQGSARSIHSMRSLVLNAIAPYLLHAPPRRDTNPCRAVLGCFQTRLNRLCFCFRVSQGDSSSGPAARESDALACSISSKHEEAVDICSQLQSSRLQNIFKIKFSTVIRTPDAWF